MTIAIIPCGGRAERFDGLLKMQLPSPSGGTLLSALIDRMKLAQPHQIVIAATNGNKRALREYAAPGVMLFDGVTPTMTDAVFKASEWASTETNVLFGMPDTVWSNRDVFQRLDARLQMPSVDVAVACWRVRPDQRGQGGQCQVADISGRITSVVDKDPACPYPYIWGALAWRPSFWPFLTPDMPHVGYGLQPAIDAGLDVRAVVFEGDFWDAGTSERYFEMIRAETDEKVTP